MAPGPFGKAWGLFTEYPCATHWGRILLKGIGLPLNQEALDLEMSLGLEDG